jgi:hypothetical protein
MKPCKSYQANGGGRPAPSDPRSSGSAGGGRAGLNDPRSTRR